MSTLAANVVSFIRKQRGGSIESLSAVMRLLVGMMTSHSSSCSSCMSLNDDTSHHSLVSLCHSMLPDSFIRALLDQIDAEMVTSFAVTVGALFLHLFHVHFRVISSILSTLCPTRNVPLFIVHIFIILSLAYSADNKQV